MGHNSCAWHRVMTLQHILLRNGEKPFRLSKMAEILDLGRIYLNVLIVSLGIIVVLKSPCTQEGW